MEFSRPQYWVGSLSLLQGIFPTQGSNPALLHCRWILYQLSHKGSPRSLSLLRGIFPTQESNWALLHCRWILYQLSYQGSPTVEDSTPEQRLEPWTLRLKVWYSTYWTIQAPILGAVQAPRFFLVYWKTVLCFKLLFKKSTLWSNIYCFILSLFGIYFCMWCEWSK